MKAQSLNQRNYQDESRDLGFGSVVARECRTRLLNRDGSFNVARRGLSFWSSLSLYHARSSYLAEEVVWNARFADIFNRPAGDGLLTIDVRKLHSIERVEATLDQTK